MNPTNSCPRCGRPSPAGVRFCGACGSNISSASTGLGWKLLFGAFALFVGVLWAAVVLTRTQPSAQLTDATQQQSLLGQGTTNTAQPAPAPAPSLTLTSAQHLFEAKRALADGYKPNKDPQKAQWGEVAATKWHLKSIGTTAAEYREAQELLKEVTKRERQIDLARKKAEADKDSEEADADDNDSSDASSAPSSSAYSSPSAAPATRQSPPASTAVGGTSDDYYTNSKGARVHRPVQSESGPPAGATAQCRDGSWHGRAVLVPHARAQTPCPQKSLRISSRTYTRVISLGRRNPLPNLHSN
jgi:hypothetical protein